MNEIKNSKRTKLLILLGVIVVIVIIIFAVSQKGKNLINPATKIPETTNNNPATTSPEEIAPSKSVVTLATATPEIIKTATSTAFGTSLVTKDNKVITPTGAPVKLNVMPGNAAAPTESAPVKGAAAIPDSVNTVKMSVSSAGFSPKEFTVKEGQLVNFVLTSGDEFTHVFRFDDDALLAAVLGVAGHETRVKSWNAPKKGTYTFRCDIPSHAARGEVGKMIVN
ncbi:MAG: cupredoxin domain-containing protein [Patescibacteria group bacterium]